ncbi:MAG: hypothetical protein GWO07_11605 [Candidatus Dadabacteria bacterium]|nr:hypothetical protein [Candidatus Dadabacteria bacterium]NIV41011.1 hypothetical protein [Candidatus Dadabacteria bacterium]NIX15918.1 hypothetical protein [Candidatus Dadabacteria bacterium]
MINKLFVYGTLLQGQSANHLLADWKLINTLQIKGTLYDTGLGYPAANFTDKTNNLFGELYHYQGKDIESTISRIDVVEGTKIGIFEREIIESNGDKFFTYNMGSGLENSRNSFSTISSGNWRHTYIKQNNISTFAIDFEQAQSTRYTEFAPADASSFVHIKGDIPILVVSSHATAHMRKGKLKSQEFYTGAIGVILNSLSGVHSIYTTYASEHDSNYSETTALKEFIRELVKTYNIKFVMDIHGTGSYRKFDIYPGIGKTGEFLNGNNALLDSLENLLKNNNLRQGGFDVFPAYKQHTVSRFVYTKLGIASMQLETNYKLRDPEFDSNSFEKLISFLTQYIESVGKLV